MNPHSFRRVLPSPTQEQIAALAYAIWEDRGRPAGSDVECWIEAERELSGPVASSPRMVAQDIAADFRFRDVESGSADDTKVELTPTPRGGTR